MGAHKGMEIYPMSDEKKDLAYYQSNLELTDVEPLLNLYDYHWPVRTDQPNLPPPKFVFDEDSGRRGLALDSIVAAGTIISGGKVRRSVLGPRVRVEERAEVSNSILFRGVQVGKGAVVRNAIIDKGQDYIVYCYRDSLDDVVASRPDIFRKVR